MFKLSRLLLLLPIIGLASCGETDPKKPVSNPSISQTSVVPTTSGELYYRGLTFKEVEEAMEKVKETRDEIKTVAGVYTISDFEVVDEEVNKTDYRLEASTKLFTNTIVFSSFYGETVDVYKRFHMYDEEKGSLVESYNYIDTNFENINTIDVYNKAGESNRNNVLHQQPYSIALSDSTFIIGRNVTTLDYKTLSDKISIAAELANGSFQISFKFVEVVAENEYISTYTYIVDDGYLLSSSARFEQNLIVSEEEKTPVSIQDMKYTYSYSSNGDFERSSLPTVDE